MGLKCPNCEASFDVSFEESLDPYSMTLRIEPQEGRLLDAVVFADTLKAFADLLKVCGEAIDHATFVNVVNISTTADGAVSAKFCVTPIKKSKGGM